VFAISFFSALTLGLGGSLAASEGVFYVTLFTVTPSMGILLTIQSVCVVALGGLGNFVGAVFLTQVQELLRTKVHYPRLTLHGGILILVGIFMPGGLVRVRLLRNAFGRLS